MSSRIGIITFHRALNYGAVLQAYALQKFLHNNDYDSETIDYSCKKFRDDYRLLKIYDKSLHGVIKSLIKLPVNYKKKKKFTNFVKYYVKTSLEFYDTSNIYNSNSVYDIFIAGSDQVWNLLLTGYDRNYLLNFVDDNKAKLSYAASMGRIGLNKELEKIILEDLSRFMAITVREKDAQSYLHTLLDRDVQLVLDPVLLLSEKAWDSIAAVPKKDKYILVYCLHENRAYVEAQRLSELTGLNVICIQNGIRKPIKAEYVYTAGPKEFIGYIKNASYVVTDSFHGAVFSIIFHKTFKVILKQKLRDLNCRMETLLASFSLLDTVIGNPCTDDDLMKSTVYNSQLIEKKVALSQGIILEMIKEAIVNEKAENI